MPALSGFLGVARLAAEGLDPTEHQASDASQEPSDQPTPSEAAIPKRGSGYFGTDVGSTAPGSGTSVSGAGSPRAPGGTMTQGSWGLPLYRRPTTGP